MKRDLELIRKILFAVEASPSGFLQGDLNIPGYTHDQTAYHCYLLVDAGLAVGHNVTHLQSTGPEYRIMHLTSAGHDFADAARNDTVWNKATKIAAEKTGSVTLDVLKQLLIATIKTSVGL